MVLRPIPRPVIDLPPPAISSAGEARDQARTAKRPRQCGAAVKFTDAEAGLGDCLGPTQLFVSFAAWGYGRISHTLRPNALRRV